jgi:hypothetical protein
MNLSDTPDGPVCPSRASGWRHDTTAGASRVALVLLCRHAVATTPAGPSMGSGCSPEIDDCGLPPASAGSAPALNVSRPIRRSLTLRPTCSRNRLTVLSIEGFGSFVTSATAPIATGWSNSCQVGLAPTEERRLCTAHGRIYIHRSRQGFPLPPPMYGSPTWAYAWQSVFNPTTGETEVEIWSYQT